MTGSTPPISKGGQQGAVLLVVLLFVLVSTLGASSLVEMHQTQTRREKEEQLLFVGDQYRRAIASYYGMVPPGGGRSLPRSIEDLLNDQRFTPPVQHLRRAYPDPMTGKLNWEFIDGVGGFAGVRSRSAMEPIKKSGFPMDYQQFESSDSYARWEFAIKVL
ncbi:MAG: type II secretion system protein [bacterium]|jgi:type II secretory pathway pseudopilin PulG